MGGLMLDERRVLADMWYIELQASSELRCIPIAASARKPSARVEHCCVLASNALCLRGGNAKIEETDTEQPVHDGPRNMPLWVQPKPSDDERSAPPPRTNHSTVVWNTKMHIFGGTDGYTWYNDMWSYEPETNRWEHIPTDTRHWKRPTRREGHAAAVGGNKMCVCGGRSEMGEDLKDFWIFDMAERRWRDSL